MKSYSMVCKDPNCGSNLCGAEITWRMLVILSKFKIGHAIIADYPKTGCWYNI